MENIKKLQGFFRMQRKKLRRKMNGKGKQTLKILGYDSWGKKSKIRSPRKP